MRSRLSWGAESRKAPEPAVPAGRPEALRRATLAVNSRILLAVAIVLMPFALYAAIQGALLPVAVAGFGLFAGLVTLMQHQGGQTGHVAAGQVYAVLVVGAILAVADPAIVDFGLATAVLAPIHAALVGDRRLNRRAWILLGLVIGIDLLSAAGVGLWPQHDQGAIEIAGGLAFTAAAIIIAHTANRLNTAFEVYDRAQINAYRHLLEHVQDAMMRYSAEGELVFSSLSSEKLLGCKRYELAGNGLLERVHVLDRPNFLTAFADANQGGRARSIEVRVRYDGAREGSSAPQFIWVEIALSPVIDEQAPGSRHEVVALFRDVTARRDQENEMRAARKAAEAASEAKSRFLATIGHELRTPLNAIIGFSEMMTGDIGGTLSPAHHEYAELIRRSGSHLLGVVGMLLDMSRIEAGKFELNAESFSPQALLEPCLHMVASLAQEKRIDVVSNLAPTLPAIVADERACRQILINLLSNAIKFSHEGGAVAISMKRQGNFLNLSVSDSGIGMSPEAIDRVGEPFFQAQDGLSRRYEGTGLGLSIVKGLVELHQGSLRVVSEAGSGTTVTVLLPINGPETKLPETGSVTPLRRESASLPEAQWPEQKRNAK